MPEPSDQDRLRRLTDVIHRIEDQDRNIQDLRALRDQLKGQFEDNTATILTGDWSAPVPYNLPEFAAFQPTFYPVDMTRQGEFVSRHPPQFQHLPSRQDVPGIVKLTLGDLDAAAEWEMLPTLNPDSRRRPKANHMRQLVEDVTYRAVMRRLFIIRQLLGQQIWDAIKDQREKGVSFQDIFHLGTISDQFTTHLTRPQVEQALAALSFVGERVVYTMAARLGSRIEPPFRTFRPRAGEDRYEHVDVLMRVEPPGSDPTLAGVDVTTKQSAQDMWDKHFRQVGQGRSATRGTLRDPANPDHYLPIHRSILSAPYGSDWDGLAKRWLQQRGATMITPEYLMLIDHRAVLGRKALLAVRQPDGTPYYTEDAIEKTYRAVYGQYDVEHR